MNTKSSIKLKQNKSNYISRKHLWKVWLQVTDLTSKKRNINWQTIERNRGVTFTIEFFCNSLFSAKSWQNPASIDGEEQNKKLPLLDIEPMTS